MSSEQREKHLVKVFKMCFMPVDINVDVSFTAASASLAAVKHLYVPPERYGITIISAHRRKLKSC